MNIVSDIKAWKSYRKTLMGNAIGFVPTMGNLHEGHLNLVRRSKNENDFTIVSIFINPTQFNQSSDFENYPKTMEDDIQLLNSVGADCLFMPDKQSMYTDNYTMRLTETEISSTLEGEHRPGHFDGMLTVVLKLLNLTQPTRAYFGEKDFQQLLLVKKMVDALFIPTEIIGCPTVRAEDGLALSSRNSRLNQVHRTMASTFHEILSSDKSLDVITQQLTQSGFQVDYISEKWGRRLGAVWLGETRLIDNIQL